MANAQEAPTAGGRPEGVVVRACSSAHDCTLVAALCGSSFPEEAQGQGLTVQQWSQIEAEDLIATPSWWPQIGLAYEGGKLLGVVVLTVENEAEDSMSWREYSRRVGCGPTILSMLYDRVLDEALLEHECLVDFIAVSPEARGKGVGAKLMAWAEEAGPRILAQMEAEAVAAHGVEMTLWVAADNAVAVRLYERCGYTAVRRTDTGACHCMASAVLKRFLGHPVWVKMRKALPVPEQLLAAPQPQRMPEPVPAAEGQFESVPLDAPVAAQAVQQPQSPGSSLLRKLTHGLLGGGAESPCSSSASAAAAAAHSQAGSQSVTPRIAAVGGSLPAAAQQAQPSGKERKRAPPSGDANKPLQPPGQLVELWLRENAAPASAAATSVASASVASLLTDGDSDSEPGSARHASKAQGAAGGQPDVFQLVELVEQSTSSSTAAAPALASARPPPRSY